MTSRLDRRQFIATSAAAAALPVLGDSAVAQAAYPNKPIKIVVGYPAGGQTDIIARTYGEFLSRQLGQPVVVDNKAGAGGIIGAVEVKRAPADGYTLMCTISTTMVQNRVTVKNLPYDADKDFVMLGLLTQVGLVMVASEKTGAKTLKEFVDYAKKTDKVSMGTYAAGSTAHMIIVELNKQYGLNIEPVHYRGEAPMWTDVGGQSLDAAIGSYNASLGVLQSGRGKPVGATGLQRLGSLPDVPTLVDQGAKSELYDLRGFTCFAAPAGTPADIVKKLSDAIVAGGKDPKLNETMNQFFLNPPIGHEEATKLFTEQTPLWVKFMEGIGLRPE
jgi:tripartite-type tricarboxylate transporter receptor subunit TctC